MVVVIVWKCCVAVGCLRSFHIYIPLDLECGASVWTDIHLG